MEKSYILLRSGKQLGPFGLQELVQSDLQPLDLVWSDNDVAGWRYASEIETLQPHIKNYIPAPAGESLENRGFTQTTNPTEDLVAEETHSHQSEYVLASVERHDDLEQADESYSNEHIEEGEIEPAIQDRSNMPFYERANAGRQYSATAVLDDGYGYSSYNRSVKNASRKNFGTKQIVIWVAGAFILIAGCVAIYKFMQQNELPQSEIARTEAPSFNDAKISEPINETSKNDIPGSTKEITAGDNEVEVPKSTEVKVEKKPVIENNTTDEKGKNNASEVLLTQANAVKPEKKPDQETNKVVVPGNEKAAVPITNLVTATSEFNNDGGGISALNVRLQNKSDKVLKMAAVNVFYTDSTNAVINKQTLYFSNVQPGQTVSKGASPHKIAKKVYCKVGLVSTEGSIFYEN